MRWSTVGEHADQRRCDEFRTQPITTAAMPHSHPASNADLALAARRDVQLDAAAVVLTIHAVLWSKRV